MAHAISRAEARQLLERAQIREMIASWLHDAAYPHGCRMCHGDQTIPEATKICSVCGWDERAAL